MQGFLSLDPRANMLFTQFALPICMLCYLNLLVFCKDGRLTTNLSHSFGGSMDNMCASVRVGLPACVCACVRVCLCLCGFWVM